MLYDDLVRSLRSRTFSRDEGEAIIAMVRQRIREADSDPPVDVNDPKSSFTGAAGRKL